VDADRRQWLEQLAAACERVLADEDLVSTALREDVSGLLSRLRAELEETAP
jgi:hypothetical protein